MSSTSTTSLMVCALINYKVKYLFCCRTDVQYMTIVLLYIVYGQESKFITKYMAQLSVIMRRVKCANLSYHYNYVGTVEGQNYEKLGRTCDCRRGEIYIIIVIITTNASILTTHIYFICLVRIKITCKSA